MKSIAVVGAGLSGLFCALKLLEKNYQVVIYEKNKIVGGLAGGYKEGPWKFDFGPHRFFSNDKKLLEGLVKIYPDMLEVRRKSSVYLSGKYLDWPLNLSSALKLPKELLAGVLLDMMNMFSKAPMKVFNSKNEGNSKNSETFESYIINRYGRTLYNNFFKEYTEKFLGIKPYKTHECWAAAGIEQALIDKRIRMGHLWEIAETLISHAVKSSVDKSMMLYPKFGMSSFVDALEKRVVDSGGTILKNTDVQPVLDKDEMFLKTEDTIQKYDHIVWTAPLTDISKASGIELDICFRSVIFFFIQLKSEISHDFQWCYFGQQALPFSRLSRPSAFSKAMVPFGKDSLCAEISCSEKSDLWKHPEAQFSSIVQAIEALKLIKSKRDILDIQYVKKAAAYPVFKLNYEKDLKKMETICSDISNLTMTGRGGLFSYNNMTQAIEMGVKAFQKVIRCS